VPAYCELVLHGRPERSLRLHSIHGCTGLHNLRHLRLRRVHWHGLLRGLSAAASDLQFPATLLR